MLVAAYSPCFTVLMMSTNLMSTIAPGWSFGFGSCIAACALLFLEQENILCVSVVYSTAFWVPADEIFSVTWDWLSIAAAPVKWSCWRAAETGSLFLLGAALLAHPQSQAFSSLALDDRFLSWVCLRHTRPFFLVLLTHSDSSLWWIWPKPVAFVSSQIVWEEVCTCAAEFCRQHREFDVMSDIEPNLPSSSFGLLCLPECGGVPAQGTLDSHCSQASVFPISLMTHISANNFY